MHRPLLCFLLLAGSLPSVAATGAAQVPSPEEVLGYALGEDFTTYEQIREYSRVLADASPAVEYTEYGETVEGRPLIQLIIARPDHLQRLDQILRLNEELTEAGTTEQRAAEIAASNPAIAYLSYGVHGNESSSSEAALWTAYDLAGGDPAVVALLDSLVVIIDPVTNPDGRMRYVSWYRSVVGDRANADPQAREHREPWPCGRFNHYLFDLNRDWAWMTQPETRARLATWWRYNPHVHVDFHEMSPNSTYFFFPASPPINPIYPDHILEWGRRFGAANATAFDARGWQYYTGENYDMLYPGYGDSWPSLHGSIGMTYEQAGGGSAGLAYARTDGDTLTLADRASHHRVAGSATLGAAAVGKTRLLLDFAAAHRSAGVDEPDVLLVPGIDPEPLAALVDHLLAQGITVEEAASGFGAGATPYPAFEQRTSFPAGTVRVPMRQPRGRLAATLLQPETELVGDYSYDVSAWSLPYAFGVEAHRVRGSLAGGAWRGGTPAAPAGAPPLLASSYGYLVPPTVEGARAVARFLAAGGVARALGQPATFSGRDWPVGTWFVPAGTDPAAAERLQAAGLGAVAVPIASGRSERGIDIGSGSTATVRLPRIALVGGDGVVPTSYGSAWFYLDRDLEIPFTALLLPELPDLDLGRYDVIVLPDMRGGLDDETNAALGTWVREGGRLVAFAAAAEAVASLAEIELRQEASAGETGPADRERFLATREQRELQEFQDEVPGAILEVGLDAGHPLAWGASAGASRERLFVLRENPRAFEPADDVEVVARFDSDLEAVSGLISEENLERLQGSGWLVTKSLGSGEVVLFGDDPLFRLFWKSTEPLFRNSLLLGSG